ncbi:universal stress protein [Prolixibacteraceae bacterium Z1-6]|uniref:Universal stress protein n=1 Tax=Draconibacterium aestuarii TaxID=2998507 RepID=A0A9X3F6H7_9BACT|nr:universal stress protein [Prolixibacteraceae bacterium Z1-6]
MNENLVTLVTLPYSKAHILKMRLEAKAIKCELEDFDLIEGSTTSTIRIKILEKDIKEALSELDYLLGLKSDAKKERTEAHDRQILVPIDFSVVSEKSARLAFNIASHINAELVIMHSFLSPAKFVIPYGDIYPYDSTLLIQSNEAEKNANVNFKEFVKKLAHYFGKDKWEALKPQFIIKPGFADEDILGYARDQRPKLIVIGRGGDKSWSGTVGSITADIMYNAPVPVLIVPENMEEKPLAEFKEFLYATNFDAKDFTALDKLMDILLPFDIQLTCAHVGEPDENSWDLARLEGMKDILQKKYENKKFDCKLIMGSDVLETLDSYLKHESIDVLALTTHKRGMISRLFNPSLARKMVFHTNTPLLVFHA